MHAITALCFALSLAVACGGTPAPAPTPAPNATQPVTPPQVETDELDARLGWLDQRLTSQREEQHAPGMAIAVIARGEVIFARGFGKADLEAGVDVTPATIFAVGSTTKAFTSTLVGSLVDEDEMQWDAPLSTYLPELELKVDGERKATVADALSHRTGFPRMTILWYSGSLAVDEIFAYAARAEPTEPVGETFQYNNIMYLAAGQAAARAAGTDWPALLRARILEPLGMTSTSLTIADAQDDPRLARGYDYNREDERFEPEPMRDITTVGPAGSINSNVIDMARWVQLQLGKGAFEGKRVISEEQLAKIHSPQIEIAPTIGYGFGWFVRDWNGKTYLEHGGNIDGFSANVGFLPDEGIGYVALFNVSNTPLQSAVGPMVFDALLTDAFRGDAPPAEDFTRFVGTYVADFPPFAGKTFEVLESGGKLAVDVPGQTVYKLEPPDAEGKRQFELTDDISVSFEMDDGGERARALYLYQAGLIFELLREGVEPKVEVDPAEIGPLLGRYENAEAGQVTVLIHRGRLAVDVPGQMKYQLHPPDEEGRRRLRTKPELYAVFDTTGKQPSLALHQVDKTVEFTRVAAPKAQPVTLERVLRLRRGQARARALRKLGTIALEGTVRLPNAGVDGKARYVFDATRAREELDLGKLGAMVTVSTPDGAWLSDPFEGTEALTGERRAQLMLHHPAVIHGDWSEHFDDVALAGTEELDGERVYVMRLSKADLPAITVHVDAKTGDVVKLDTSLIEMIGEIPVSIRYADFQKIGGVRLPKAATIEDPLTGKIVLDTSRVRRRVPTDAATFSPEPPRAPELD